MSIKTIIKVFNIAVMTLMLPLASDTGSTRVTQDKLNQELEQIISSMTVEEKVAQLFVVVPEALASNAQTTTTAAFGSVLAKYPVGGIIYMSANIQNPSQITEAVSKASQYAESACKLPLLLSLDEEGGRVARIGNNANFNVTKIKPMREIGDSGDTAKAYVAGDTIGSYLQDYGFNMDFAPVLDTITNPDNTVIGNRSFGTDPELVWSMASQVSAGLKKHRIISCYKHFPNHGSTEGDTHAGYAYTSKTLEELKAEDLVPFKAAVDAGCNCIMAAHISVPNVIGDDTPTSMSKVMLTDILRDDLGYQGVIITDALGMGAVSNNYSSGEAALGAFRAGADLLLMPKNFQEAYNAVLAAVKDGRISQGRLDASIYRIGKMKLSR